LILNRVIDVKIIKSNVPYPYVCCVGKFPSFKLDWITRNYYNEIKFKMHKKNCIRSFVGAGRGEDRKGSVAARKRCGRE